MFSKPAQLQQSTTLIPYKFLQVRTHLSRCPLSRAAYGMTEL